jgi:hypothetical protein
MKVTRSGVIAANVGAMLIGIVVASMVALAIGRLWSGMQIPVFCTTLVCWVLWGITVVLRDRGKREINPVAWHEGREYAAFSRTSAVLNRLAATLFGFVLASLAGGLVGLQWSGAKWPVFFVVLAVCTLGGFVLLLRDAFGVDIRRNM